MSTTKKGTKRNQRTTKPEAAPTEKKKPRIDESATTSKYFSTATPDASVDANAGGDTKINSKLPFTFFDRSCIELAKALLGKKFVRTTAEGKTLEAAIVETEAYLGGDDKAAHSYNGKRTERIEAMYMKPGTIYVYNIYGVYSCVNISSQGDGAAVLIRALDPIRGTEEMRAFRQAKQPNKGDKTKKVKEMKEKDLGNGPSKLTQALVIDKATFNQKDITTSNSLWLEPGFEVTPDDIVTTSRVGVDYAKEWASKPLRFYVLGNKSVSVRDKQAEAEPDHTAREQTDPPAKPKTKKKGATGGK